MLFHFRLSKHRLRHVLIPKGFPISKTRLRDLYSNEYIWRVLCYYELTEVTANQILEEIVVLLHIHFSQRFTKWPRKKTHKFRGKWHINVHFPISLFLTHGWVSWAQGSLSAIQKWRWHEGWSLWYARLLIKPYGCLVWFVFHCGSL